MDESLSARKLRYLSTELHFNAKHSALTHQSFHHRINFSKQNSFLLMCEDKGPYTKQSNYARELQPINDSPLFIIEHNCKHRFLKLRPNRIQYATEINMRILSRLPRRWGRAHVFQSGSGATG